MNISNKKIISLEELNLPKKLNNDFFNCSDNKKLTSLKGCPQEGVTDFYCDGCNLLSLEYAPYKINGMFTCTGNKKLTSLKGAPQEGVTNFLCYNCNLLSLDGAPYKINGKFDCSYNENLTTLKGCPQKGVTDFYCDDCNLLSLEYAPYKINGIFNCSYNINLTSFKGCPQEGVNGFLFNSCISLVNLADLPIVNKYEYQLTKFEKYNVKQLIFIAKLHQKGIFNEESINKFIGNIK